MPASPLLDWKFIVAKTNAVECMNGAIPSTFRARLV
jgi:hypothetical protein